MPCVGVGGTEDCAPNVGVQFGGVEGLRSGWECQPDHRGAAGGAGTVSAHAQQRVQSCSSESALVAHLQCPGGAVGAGAVASQCLGGGAVSCAQVGTRVTLTGTAATATPVGVEPRHSPQLLPVNGGDEDSPPLSLRCAVVNLGQGGLNKRGVDASTIGAQVCAGVLILSETHCPSGGVSQHAVPGFSIVVGSRAAIPSSSLLGGVAVAVAGGCGVTEAVAVESCQVADIVVVRLTVAVGYRPLFVVAVYLPPDRPEFCCTCSEASCPRAHVAEGLYFIERVSKELALQGDVVVAGDFNAHAEGGREAGRWRRTSDLLVGVAVGGAGGVHQPEGLCLMNPVHEGKLVPTRGDAVLDLVLVSSSAAARTGVVVVEHLTQHHGPWLDHHVIAVEVRLDRAPLLPLAEAGSGEDGCIGPVPVWLSTLVHKPIFCDPLEAMAVGAGGAVRASAKRVFADRVHRALCEAAPGGVFPDMAALPAERSTELLAGAIRTAVSRTGVKRRAGLSVVHPYKSEEDIQQWSVVWRKLTRAQRRHDRASITRYTAEMRGLSAKFGRQRRQWRREAEARELGQLDDAFLKQVPGVLAPLLNAVGAGALTHRLDVAGGSEAELRQCVAHLQQRYGVANTSEALVEEVATIRLRMQQECASRDPVTVATEITAERVATALAALKTGPTTLAVPSAVLAALGSSPDLCDAIAKLFRRIWVTGDIPPDFPVVKATMVPKDTSGLISNCRVIGTCWSLSKLFQGFVLEELERLILPRVSKFQFGNQPGKSTLQCAWLCNSAVECARQDGHTVRRVYLDIMGAYGSVSHDLVLKMLSQLDVSPFLWRVVDAWLRNQTMFVKRGKRVSDQFRVRVGVVEGCRFAPILFILLINALLVRLGGHWQEGGGLGSVEHPLTFIFFCDDGTILTTNVKAMQALLDIATDGLGELRLRVNVKPTKSVVQEYRPVNRDGTYGPALPPEPLVLAGQQLPFTDWYRYLGVYDAELGRAASGRLHLRSLTAKTFAIMTRVLSSKVRLLPMVYGLSVHLTRWWTTVSYGLWLLLDNEPSCLAKLEKQLLARVVGTSSIPCLAIKLLLGIPSMRTRIRLDMLRHILTLAALPPDSQLRVQACVELRKWAGATEACRKRLWMSPALALLEDLVRVSQGPADREVVDVIGGMRTALSNRVQYTVKPDTPHALKQALLRVEAETRRAAIQKHSSLVEVVELLDTPNFAPYIADLRTPASFVRTLARGGVMGWFGFDERRRPSAHFMCPHCRTAEFTVFHLVQDCPAFQDLRHDTYTKVLVVLTAAKVASAVYSGAGDENARLWALLALGAAVPNSFVELALDSPTHFGRVKRTETFTGHLRMHLHLLRVVWRITGELLMHIDAKTRTILTQCGHHVSPDPAPRARLFWGSR